MTKPPVPARGVDLQIDHRVWSGRSTRKASPALAAGCTMVVKPAEQTPLTALALAELAERAGVPARVFNVVVGKAREIGPELTGNPIVRKARRPEPGMTVAGTHWASDTLVSEAQTFCLVPRQTRSLSRRWRPYAVTTTSSARP
ncbi:aldehyde dehydrogenase family protein [Streptomyces bottropensis]|uniref:aldehyde dehydrogenase family protein n=2 Tax=Streptomyces bottropensis TaxID=42235 RepID=UPI003691C1DB